MTAGVLGIGVSGLRAYQLSLATVSHNIANANSDGYSRQVVNLGTQTPLRQGTSYLGTGVKLQSIERIHDDFLTSQVRSFTSSFNEASIFSQFAGQLDEMVADPQIGLMPAVESFFSAVQGVSNNPVSPPARQSMISQGESLVDRFQYMDQRFRDVRSQVNQKMDNLVSEINTLAEGIADLNRSIALAQGFNPPNDLKDQRDVMLEKLAEKISITTLEQDNGSIDVFVGRGQILVLNFDSQHIDTSFNQHDLNQNEVSIDTGGNMLEISDFIAGGELGGLISFRDNVLNPSQNAMGILAIGLSDTFNAQQRLGQDMNGDLGVDFFKNPSLNVLPTVGAPDVVTANLTDSSQLTNDEYLLTYDGGTNYTLANLTQNTSTSIDTGGVFPFDSVSVDGFNVTISGPGSTVGESYLIRPGRLGALELGVAVTDPRQVAAASPLRTERNLNNIGGGVISQGVVTSVSNTPTGTGLGGDITVEYNAGNLQITGATVTGSPVIVSYTPGETISLNLTGDITGFEFNISGAPQDGDSFTITDNIGGVGDNRNILASANLQTERMLDNGNSSYDEFYGNLVADVGIQTNQATVTEGAQERLLEQARNNRDSLSGVNLDEEAAALIKFQQAYQAASQVIVASNTMFDSLLAAIRR